MEKKLAVFSCVFGLLAGCTEMNHSGYSSEEQTTNPVTENFSQPDIHTANFVLENMLHLTFDETYFMETGQNFKITSPSEKLKKEVIANNSESQRVNTVYGTVREDNRISGKWESEEKRAYVTCRYLGKLNEKHIVARIYNSGGSGTFTDIVQCSIEKGNLHIDDVSMLGDRALDGIVGCSMDCGSGCLDRPYLGPDENLYLKMWLSISTIASLAGVSDEDMETGPFQAAQEFWNISDCIYNLRTRKLEIISMDINFTDMNSKEQSASDVAKILKTIFPNQVKTIRIEKNEMAEFLSKFKTAYLKISRTNKTK